MPKQTTLTRPKKPAPSQHSFYVLMLCKSAKGGDARIKRLAEMTF